MTAKLKFQTILVTPFYSGMDAEQFICTVPYPYQLDENTVTGYAPIWARCPHCFGRHNINPSGATCVHCGGNVGNDV